MVQTRISKAPRRPLIDGVGQIGDQARKVVELGKIRYSAVA